MQDELATLHADLLASALRAGGPHAAARSRRGAGALERAAQARARSRRPALKEDLAAAGALDLAMLSVATAELRTLV